MNRALAVHLIVVAVLAAGIFLLPVYHATNLARIMVLAVFAMGYNLAFGYTGLLSLGHAMFFAAGMYAAGLGMTLQGWSAGLALLSGPIAGAALALAAGALALRTAGVSFMIVTLMLAQAGYLTILYYTPITRGEEGFVLAQSLRRIGEFDLSADLNRGLFALGLFAAGLFLSLALVKARFGRIMVAMRENEERSRMLGYNPFTVKLSVMGISGAYAGAAGAAYALLFGSVGASFGAIAFSILPLLWVLLGGGGTTLGPLLGAGLMFYLTDIASSYTSAHQFVVGAALLVLVLFAPRGILGALRERGLKWLP